MIGFWERIAFAFRCFFSILIHGRIPADIQAKLAGPNAAPPAPEASPAPVSRLKVVERLSSETPDRALQILALFQRDGRLIDFLSEDITPYPDAQLGAAARTIHETCRQVLDRYIKLEPILNSEEEQPVTVQAGFDPAAIKLVGNIRGEPPIRGVLRHKGWRASEIKLPPLPEAGARLVIAPAEVEVP